MAVRKKGTRKKAGRRRKAAPRRRTRRTARKRTGTAKAARAQRPPSTTAGGTGSGSGLRTGYQVRDAEIERLLLAGGHQSLLEEYFGEDSYEELRALAQETARRSVRGGPRVLILPGIMGSKIGRERWPLFDDVIWIDPVDITIGRLTTLSLDRPTNLKALGVMLFAYLKLKLRLRIAGFDADFHAFDWRQGIDRLGADLRQRILGERAGPVHVVAHSMGGLVMRAALGLDHRSRQRRKMAIGRFVMLGTPNFGSFTPVQALRASHPLVRKVALLDAAHSPEELTEKVFKTLPGLYQMLPHPARYSRLNLYKAATWPGDAPVPRQALLNGVRAVQDGLAPADDRFYLICGVNRSTITDLSLDDGHFQYEQSMNGDGTVPLDFAELPNTRTYYIEESHGSLPNNTAVGKATVDLLRTGDTDRLLRRWERESVRRRRLVREADLRVAPFQGRAGSELGYQERRQVLEELVSAVASAPGPGGPVTAAPTLPPAIGAGGRGFGHSIRDVQVDRRRSHSIEICLAHGDLTEVKTRALVLGLFREVEPAGAAAAVDERVNGALKECVMRRMFTSRVGEVFVLPTGRHLIYAESVLFAGLGDFGTFGPDVQQFVAENVVRTFIRTHVEEFATVLIGAATGLSVPAILYNQLAGYFRGLFDADDSDVMRRITLCERDADRYLEMKEEVYRLASTDLFADMRVTFDEMTLPEPRVVSPRGRRAQIISATQAAYLFVTTDHCPEGPGDLRPERLAIRSSVLTAGDKAAVITGTREVDRSDLDRKLGQIEASSFTFGRLARFGQQVADLVLDPGVAKALLAMRKHHLIVVHDALASRIPWETLCIEGWFPAAEAGVSRRYAAENLSVAKWLEQRRFGSTLDVLLVVNPTGDLPGAVQEANRVKRLFQNDLVRLHELREEEATHAALLEAFKSGEYDVIHYAGHAFFDPESRARSGILCHGGRVLSGADLAGITHVPALLFFNACETGRVRRGDLRKKPALDMRERVNRNVGLAEAFMRGGAANYVGTYWPVGDEAAAAFAETFYRQLVGGASIGDAVQAGRKRVHGLESIDWADYIHYGAYDFTLKVR